MSTTPESDPVLRFLGNLEEQLGETQNRDEDIIHMLVPYAAKWGSVVDESLPDHILRAEPSHRLTRSIHTSQLSLPLKNDPHHHLVLEGDMHLGKNGDLRWVGKNLSDSLSYARNLSQSGLEHILTHFNISTLRRRLRSEDRTPEIQYEDMFEFTFSGYGRLEDGYTPISFYSQFVKRGEKVTEMSVDEGELPFDFEGLAGLFDTTDQSLDQLMRVIPPT